MKVGNVTERTDGGSSTRFDADELDRAGVDLGATGRLQLMFKLAEGTGLQVGFTNLLLYKVGVLLEINMRLPRSTLIFLRILRNATNSIQIQFKIILKQILASAILIQGLRWD